MYNCNHNIHYAQDEDITNNQIWPTLENEQYMYSNNNDNNNNNYYYDYNGYNNNGMYKYNNYINLYPSYCQTIPISENINENNSYNHHNHHNNHNHNEEHFNNEEQQAYNDFLQETGQRYSKYADEEEEMEEMEKQDELDEELAQVTSQHYNHPEFGPIQPPIEHDPLNPPPPLDFDDIKQIKDQNKLFMLGHDGFWIMITILHKSSDGFTICHEDGKEYFIDAIEGIFPVFYNVPNDPNLPNIQKLKINSTEEKKSYKKMATTEIEQLIGKELLIDIPGQGMTPMTYKKYDANNGRSYLESRDGNINQMFLESFSYQMAK